MLGEARLARARAACRRRPARRGDRVVRRAKGARARDRLGAEHARRRCGRASPPAPRRASAAGGSTAGAAPPSTCRCPAGPTISTLWPPAAATSSARSQRVVAAQLARSPRSPSGGAASSAAASTGGRGRRLLAGQEPHELEQRLDRRDLEPVDQRRLGRVRARHHERRAAGRARRLRHHDRAAHRAAPSRRARARRTARTTRAARCAPGPTRPARAAASARSKPGPAFLRSAGARFTVIRRSGNSKPELSSAARTRSRDSCTAASGRPTIVNAGRPGVDVRLDGDGHAVDSEQREGEGAGEHRRDPRRPNVSRTHSCRSQARARSVATARERRVPRRRALTIGRACHPTGARRLGQPRRGARRAASRARRLAHRRAQLPRARRRDRPDRRARRRCSCSAR